MIPREKAMRAVDALDAYLQARDEYSNQLDGLYLKKTSSEDVQNARVNWLSKRDSLADALTQAFTHETPRYGGTGQHRGTT